MYSFQKQFGGKGIRLTFFLLARRRGPFPRLYLRRLPRHVSYRIQSVSTVATCIVLHDPFAFHSVSPNTLRLTAQYTVVAGHAASWTLLDRYSTRHQTNNLLKVF